MAEQDPTRNMDKQVSFSGNEVVIGSALLPSPSEDSEHIERNSEEELIATNGQESKPLYVTDAEKWLHDATHAHEYVCIVLFRGHWCSYDHAYLTEFGKLHNKHMKKNGVHLIAWTSEGPEGASLADKNWNLTRLYGYDQVIGDSFCALAKWLKEDEILPNLVFSTPEEARVVHKITPGTYKEAGIVQPGVAFYAHHGILVMHWEAKVTEPTYGGAHRPSPAEMWKKVEGRKHALDHGNAAMPINGDSLKHTCEKLDGYCKVM